MSSIGFIGGGNMAEALIKGITAAKVFGPEDIFVSDIKAERLKLLDEVYKVKAFSDNRKLASTVDIVVLSVEPKQLAGVLEEIKASHRKGTLFVSIAAGQRISKIKEILGKAVVIRVMPNTPALIGQGACGVFAPADAKRRLDEVVAIFSSVGKVFVLENEDMIDVVTAVSGSGPAYFFLLMENMIKAAAGMGFSQELAAELVVQTAKGAALLAEHARGQGLGPEQLRNKIVSRGGTTEAALNIFSQAGFDKLVLAAVNRAHLRAKELSA